MVLYCSRLSLRELFVWVVGHFKITNAKFQNLCHGRFANGCCRCPNHFCSLTACTMAQSISLQNNVQNTTSVIVPPLDRQRRFSPVCAPQSCPQGVGRPTHPHLPPKGGRCNTVPYCLQEYLTMNSCYEPCNRAACGVYADKRNPGKGLLDQVPATSSAFTAQV